MYYCLPKSIITPVYIYVYIFIVRHCGVSILKEFSKLRLAYNNIFRNRLGYCRRDSASSMFVSNRIDSFEARIRKSCLKFRERLLASSNTIILTLNDNTWIRSNYIWRKWTNIMYYGAYKL